MDRRIGERQRWVWLASGLSGAVAARICGLNWAWVLGAGLLVALYYIYIDMRLHPHGVAELLPAVFGKAGKILAAIVLLWTILLMAWAANLANGAFPMVKGGPVLGWTVLALAAWGSWKGPAACARCAGVLCLFLLALYGVIGGFAIPDVQLKNLLPVGTWEDGLQALGVFLLPSAVWYLPCTRSRKKPMWQMALLLPAFGAGLAIVTSGVLSPLLARSQAAALYTLAQSVSLFGVVERIEPLLSAAMTMGVFCLLSAMACACGQLWGQLRPWRWSEILSCVAAAALMGWAENLDFRILALGTAVVYVLLPLLALGKNRNRTTNSRNMEN